MYEELTREEQEMVMKIKWKLEKIIMVHVWYFHFSVLHNHVSDL